MLQQSFQFYFAMSFDEDSVVSFATHCDVSGLLWRLLKNNTEIGL